MSGGQGPLPRFEARLQLDGTTAVVTIAGDLDLHSAPRARKALAQAEHHEPETILVDLSGLAFIDSAGVSMLFAAAMRARAAGRRLALRNCVGAPRRTLEMRALSGVLEMVDEPPRAR